MSNTKHDDGGPMYPVQVPPIPAGHYYCGPLEASGLPVADWFAGLAMQGMFASKTFAWGDKIDTHQMAAKAYSIADAMIAEKRRREPSDD